MCWELCFLLVTDVICSTFSPKKRQLAECCLSNVLFLHVSFKHVTFFTLSFVWFRLSISLKFLDLSEWYCRKSILALVDGQPWDMYKPLTKSCEIQFLTFKDRDPGEVNKVFLSLRSPPPTPAFFSSFLLKSVVFGV